MLGREVLDGRQLQPARLDALAHRPQVPFVPEALLVRHHLAGLVGENDMGRPQLPGELHVPGGTRVRTPWPLAALVTVSLLEERVSSSSAATPRGRRNRRQWVALKPPPAAR